MKIKLQTFIFSIFLFSFCSVFGQNVALYQQFDGHYNFTFIGNTMNVAPNGANDPCLVLTSSSANLNLSSGNTIEAAYLYWAGSGTGDFNVKLNDIAITPDRTFAAFQGTGVSARPFFSAFKDVTAQVLATGNASYTLSDLDISPFLMPNVYCNNGTNFAGWAIVVVYKNDSLPINHINIYDGLEAISTSQTGTFFELTINLPNLNVIYVDNAQLGYVAWEGDANIANQESLRINGDLISGDNNPENNIFNGTNNIPGSISTTLYNMDLDVFSIEDHINVGDTSLEIKLTTAQDFVLINCIVTVLNSQLPDATVAITDLHQECDSREITVDYTVSNFNGQNPLISQTPIAVYANGQLLGQAQTTTTIPVGGSEIKQITLTIPDTIPDTFTLLFVVDDNGSGSGIREEIDESNNTFSMNVTLWFSPEFNALEAMQSCNEGLTRATFDFSDYADDVKVDPSHTVSFYPTLTEAETETNPIVNPSNYTAPATPMELFVRVENEHCYSITSFLLYSINCPLTVYNYVSGNGDGINETFTIKGLRDVFVNFELSLYNRWGKLIWTGNNQTPDWDGLSNQGQRLDNGYSAASTYYYILHLNDESYPEPISGFLYFNR